TKELTKKIRMSAPSDGRSDSSTIPNSATQRYAMRNRSTSTNRTATAIGLPSAPPAAARTVRGSLFHRTYPARPVATTSRKRIRNQPAERAVTANRPASLLRGRKGLEVSGWIALHLIGAGEKLRVGNELLHRAHIDLARAQARRADSVLDVL